MEYDVKSIKKSLKKELDYNRYTHTIGVAYTATSLSMRYDYDLKKAEVAGLLHDCAKSLAHKRKIEICMANNISITDIEVNHPDLLHAKVGAFLAKDQYKIMDPDILNAILYHTTGRPNMTLLEKIIFISDYIEPNRKERARLKEIRSLAFIDMDVCLAKILEDTIEYIELKNKLFDPLTEETYQFYNQKIANITL
jgi:predicted HD superfamily hydrolase involved in NAD metabolism